MQVRSRAQKVEPPFKKFTLELDINTKEQASLIRFLFNYSPLCDAMRDYAKIPSLNIMAEIDEACGVGNDGHIEIRNLFITRMEQSTSHRLK